MWGQKWGLQIAGRSHSLRVNPDQLRMMWLVVVAAGLSDLLRDTQRQEEQEESSRRQGLGGRI